MDTDRSARATRLLKAHAEVRDAVVLETTAHGTDPPGPALLAVVLPDHYCNGADLRDALIAALGTDPGPPVVVFADDAAFAECRADSGALLAIAADAPYVYRMHEPTTELEHSICAVIVEVLGRERVSLSDNFVELGGDSMAAIRVVNELDRRLGIVVPVESLFDTGSIGELVALADTSPARPARG